jgi:hypothetical protein
MNRHFYNFVAIFNWSSKTNRRIITFPLRNKQILVVLNLLTSEGVIAGFELPKAIFYNHCGAPMFGKKLSNYYTPVKIFFKDGPRPIIKTVGSPGKRMYYTHIKLARVWRKVSSSAYIYVSSSKLKRICNATELVNIRQGGTPLFIVHFDTPFNI